MTQKAGKIKGAWLRNQEVDRAALKPFPAWVLPILVALFIGSGVMLALLVVQWFR